MDAGSPVAGVLQTDDVILGLGSTLFTNDARRAFGMAITEAEKTGQLRGSRSGATGAPTTT